LRASKKAIDSRDWPVTTALISFLPSQSTIHFLTGGADMSSKTLAQLSVLSLLLLTLLLIFWVRSH
jgi:hypothetical protein